MSKKNKDPELPGKLKCNVRGINISKRDKSTCPRGRNDKGHRASVVCADCFYIREVK